MDNEKATLKKRLVVLSDKEVHNAQKQFSETGLNSNQSEAKTVSLHDLPNPFTFFMPIKGGTFTMGWKGQRAKQKKVTLSNFSS